MFAKTLRDHFVKTTVAKQFKFSESVYLQNKTNNPNSIDAREAYQQFIYTEQPIDPQDIEGKELAPVFERFCADGQKWYDQASVADQTRVKSVFEDYLIMRRAAREETYILTLNKVGIERDQKKMRENVARHVGLSMPKTF